jgi:hypothetical protein
VKLDFTMTACVRPEILRRTLISFRDRLHDVCLADSTLFLNVDPVPCELPDLVVDVASKFFAAVIPRFPPKPSFPMAVKWCWLQPTTHYFFHLEDDWELAELVSVASMAKILDDSPTLTCVNLRAYDADNDLICLCPGLFRAAHAKVISDRLSLTANPEKQLRPASSENPEGGQQAEYTGTRYPNHRIIFDIGRVWLRASGWRKDRDEWFTRWDGLKRFS